MTNREEHRGEAYILSTIRMLKSVIYDAHYVNYSVRLSLGHLAKDTAYSKSLVVPNFIGSLDATENVLAEGWSYHTMTYTGKNEWRTGAHRGRRGDSYWSREIAFHESLSISRTLLALRVRLKDLEQS
jgi:hypothetical protein